MQHWTDLVEVEGPRNDQRLEIGGRFQQKK